MVLQERFAQPVEGFSYHLPARIAATTLISALLVACVWVGFTKPTSVSMVLQMAALVMVVLATGYQVVFGKTRIDAKGLHRNSFYKPMLHWYEVNSVSLQGLFFAPRLAVGSVTGPVRFHAGTPELLAAFKEIVTYYKSGN